MRGVLRVLSTWLACGLVAGHASAAPCGSALLLEVEGPAAFDGFDSARPLVAHFWEAGAGGTNGSQDGCRAGCTAASGANCAGAGECVALTGVNWLNATCAVAGHRPLRSVFVLEQTTVDSGGRWAAINLDRNSSDGNTDLDAKAASVCGGCASIASALLGGDGTPQVTNPTVAGGHLTADLAWAAPSAAAQALSNGANLLRSYTVYFKIDAETPPPTTGDRAGWSQTPDLQADGGANGGHSTNTAAAVDVSLPVGDWFVTFAVGLNLDGSGNPTADANTRPSLLLSDQSAPIQVSIDSGIFADGFETGDTSRWSSVAP